MPRGSRAPRTPVKKTPSASVPIVDKDFEIPKVEIPVKTEVYIPKVVVFDGCKVLEVLNDGHTRTHYRCSVRSAGGDLLTMHVPKSEFK